MKSSRIILDTNLWISFLISKKFDKLDELIENKNIILCFSHELIEEFIVVVSRPKFKMYFSENNIERILTYFDEFGELTTVASNVQLCRDEKDNFLLNLSKDAKADFLITGDKDLLVLKTVGQTKITTFTAFIEAMK